MPGMLPKPPWSMLEAPDSTANERERLAVLHALRLLDTDPEKVFDDLTKLASMICGVPISLVSLVDSDRQWFKSRHGLDASETPREISFCGHAIVGTGPFVVPDALDDVRFHDNPLVSGDPEIRFYAGIPLRTSGRNIGTMCVIDRVPRSLTDQQVDALERIAAQVVSQFELRRGLFLLERRNEDLDAFTRIASHDLRAPIRRILQLHEWVAEEFDDTMQPIRGPLEMMEAQARSMQQMLTSLLAYARAGSDAEPEPVSLQQLLDELAAEMDMTGQVVGVDLPVVFGSRIALRQILQNLVGNAREHAQHDELAIEVTATRGRTNYRIEVSDNGPGIPLERQSTVFELLKTSRRSGIGGLGLAIVRKLVRDGGGEVGLQSDGTSGSTFWFNWPRTD